jgi:hypothetical protein
MVEKVSVLTADGREAELRIRSRRRVAARADQLPSPPPPKMFLMCNGARVELRLSWDRPMHGFYVYYVPAEDYGILADALKSGRRAMRCVLLTESLQGWDGEKALK